MRLYNAVGLGALAALLLTGGGCAKPASPPPPSAETPEAAGPAAPVVVPAITVNDQMISDKKVAIEKTVTTASNWVIIHRAADGKPGAVIGSSLVSAGENNKFSVEITAPPASDKLIAMLHADGGEKGVYEPAVDAPITNESGQPVMTMFAVLKAAPPEAPKASSEPEKKNGANETSSGEAETAVFTIKAKQWEFEPAAITVKKGQKVQLKISSVDVTHGFSLPEFKVRVNLEPGQTQTVEFVASQAGTFTFSCSVFCGDGHGGMKGTLVVKE